MNVLSAPSVTSLSRRPMIVLAVAGLLVLLGALAFGISASAASDDGLPADQGSVQPVDLSAEQQGQLQQLLDQ